MKIWDGSLSVSSHHGMCASGVSSIIQAYPASTIGFVCVTLECLCLSVCVWVWAFGWVSRICVVVCGWVCLCVWTISEKNKDNILKLIKTPWQNYWWLIVVQYSTVQYSKVQYSTVIESVQYSTVQYSTVQYSTLQYSTVQYSTVHY